MDVTQRREQLQPRPAPRAGRREYLGLAVLGLPTILLALDLSVLNLAVPRLTDDLRPTPTQLLWILDIYGFMVAGFLVTMGTLGDRIGRRRLLLIGAAAFAAASVAAAYSTSATMLLAARALLGIAGATLAPSTLALITTIFRDPRQRTVAIGVSVSCFMGGAAVGPLVGGLLLQHFWWGSVFLLGVPVMAVLLVAGPLVLPEHRDPRAGRLDLVSVALLLATMLPVVYAVKELARGGPAPLSLAAAAGGGAFGFVFVRRQRRRSDPLLDLKLFGERRLSAALVILTLGVATQAGTMFVIGLHLQLVHGLSPLAAGLWTLPASPAMIGGALLAPLVARRAPPHVVVVAGMILAAAGYTVLTQLERDGGLAALVLGLVLVFFGIGAMATLTQDLVLGAVPPQRAGSAAAISQTGGDLGIALGIALLGAAATAVYRAGLPAASTANSTITDGTIADAVSAAGELPRGPAAALLDAAYDAFTAALHVVSATSAVVAAALAILAALMLRPHKPERSITTSNHR